MGIRVFPFTHALPYSSIPFRPSPSAQVFLFFVQKVFPKMSGSRAGGKWMASTVREKDIKKLRGAGYLAKRIGHRLPTAGQIVPTPEPHKRVVFLPHFVRGLGFPLHPFVRGIMYYYGIDFHDLSQIPSLTSRHSSSCARPFSASCRTLAYG